MNLRARVVTDLDALASARDDWAALVARAAASAPTTTPTWMLHWWRTFGDTGGRALRAVLVFEGARLVGLAPLQVRPMRSRVGIPFRRMELLASGEDEADEIGSDYIGVLAERGFEPTVAEAVAREIAEGALGPWDELALDSMNGDATLPMLLTAALRDRGMVVRTEVVGVSQYVRLPASWDDYLAALPSRRRQRVARTLRDFDRWADGTTRIERARTRADLPRGLAILEALHTERWAVEGHAGVFASPRFRAFHAAVMPELLDAGVLDLWWMTVRGEPIAAAYNLRWEDRVQFYQAGRSTRVPRDVRPGIAMHARAIRTAIEERRREYDFLPGEARYKSELAIDARPIVRLRAARPTIADAARQATELAIEEVRALRRAAKEGRP